MPILAVSIAPASVISAAFAAESLSGLQRRTALAKALANAEIPAPPNVFILGKELDVIIAGLPVWIPGRTEHALLEIAAPFAAKHIAGFVIRKA